MTEGQACFKHLCAILLSSILKSENNEGASARCSFQFARLRCGCSLKHSLAIDYKQPLATCNYSTVKGCAKNWLEIYNSYYRGPENETYVSNHSLGMYAPKQSGAVKSRCIEAGFRPLQSILFLENDGYKQFNSLCFKDLLNFLFEHILPTTPRQGPPRRRIRGTQRGPREQRRRLKCVHEEKRHSMDYGLC